MVVLKTGSSLIFSVIHCTRQILVRPAATVGTAAAASRNSGSMSGRGRGGGRGAYYKEKYGGGGRGGGRGGGGGKRSFEGNAHAQNASSALRMPDTSRMTSIARHAAAPTSGMDAVLNIHADDDTGGTIARAPRAGARPSGELGATLQRIDGKQFPAYHDIEGTWEFPGFRLLIERTQGDPYAAPTRVRVQVPRPCSCLCPVSL